MQQLGSLFIIGWQTQNTVDENLAVFLEKFETQTKLQPTLLDIIQTRFCLDAERTLELAKEK